MTGIPVHISDDPTWPADRWALVEDGVVVSDGYGQPFQPRRPVLPPVGDPAAAIKITGV